MKRKKKRGKKGFTLTEMLCTVLIMSLVVSSAVTGMVALSNSYKKVLRTSNAEELCNMLTTAMTGELSYAKYVETADGSGVVTSFYSASYRTGNYILEDGKLKVQTTDNQKFDVIADKTYADGLQVTALNVTFNEASQMFTVEFQIGDSQTNELTSTQFQVKDLNM